MKRWLRDRAPQYAAIAAGGMTTALALDEPADFLRSVQVALGLAIVGLGAYAAGMSRARELVVSVGDALGRLPGGIVLTRDDDGRVHAFVTTVSGDVRLIAIPDEDAESPADAMRYVIGQLLPDDHDAEEQ